MLPLDDFAILCIDRFNGGEQAAFYPLVIVRSRELQSDRAPHIIDPWQLFEQRRSLEEHGVREHYDAPGWLEGEKGTTQLHQVQPEQTDLRNFARYSGDCHPLADANAPAPDQKKIGNNRQDNALHGYRKSRRGESGEG